IEKNPFLKNYYNTIEKYKESSKNSSTASGGALPNLASLGGIDVTNIADGLAQFLIKRGKDELNVAFFNGMKKFLNAHKECETLFPATTLFLNNIESYKYAELIQS